MTELQALGELIKAIFRAWDTPITLPWIGETSLFKMSIALAVMGIIVTLINRFYGGDGDD